MSGSPLGRVVEIADNGRHLAKDRGFLSVLVAGEEIGRVPLDDIAAVVATAPGTTLSCVLVAELAARGIPFTVCDRNFRPAAILWPCAGHFEQQRRMEAQVAATTDLKARLWAQLVSTKIERQGAALRALGHRHGAFDRLAATVVPGDVANVEAQAARRYWPLMFGKKYRRSADKPGINSLLNYGYTVLRAATARAIVAAGLHPGIGLFHRHPQNPMPLADDLMEPFRPDVDLAVSELVTAGRLDLSPDTKRSLVGVLSRPIVLSSGTTPLSTAVLRLAQSLGACFANGAGVLTLPLARAGGEDVAVPADGEPDDDGAP